MFVTSMREKFSLAVVLMILSILILWIILAIPLLLYHLPKQASNQTNSTMEAEVNNTASCSNPVLYDTSGGLCLEALETVSHSLHCPLDSTGLLVMQVKESEAMTVKNGLAFLGASLECRREALPFLCLFLFGLCSGETLIQPTARECRRLKDLVCQNEWKIINKNFGAILPDCNNFPVETSMCHRKEKDDNQANRSLSFEEFEELECSEDFIRTNISGSCVPNCYSWSQYSKEVSIAIDVLVITFSLSGFVASIVVIIIAVCSYKIMFRYPSILIIYMNLDILMLTFLVLLPYASGKEIFCSSMNLLESVINITTFCTVSGMLIAYMIFQLSIWWLLHMAVLFYSIKYPIRARMITKGKKRTFLHTLSVVLGLLVPLIPIIASMADYAVEIRRQPANALPWRVVPSGYGFGLSGYPPIICTGLNRHVIFYSTIFPLGFVLGLGGSLLVISIWLLHQEKNKHFGKAEKKLLLIFSYYLVLTIFSQITITLRLIDIPKSIAALQDYILCEQSGHNPTSPCDRSDVEHHGNPLVALLALLAVELLPAVLLVFVVNVGEIKKCLSLKSKSKRKGLTANSTNISFDL